MEPDNTLVRSKNGYCLAKKGEVYAIYLFNVKASKLNLARENGRYEIAWYDPRKGGALQHGTIKIAEGGSVVELGKPPSAENEDWTVLVKKISDQ